MQSDSDSASMHGTAEAFGEGQGMRVIAPPLNTLLEHCAHNRDIVAHPFRFRKVKEASAQ